jgi:hypothetical protein
MEIALNSMIQTVSFSFSWFNLSIFTAKTWPEMLLSVLYEGASENGCQSRTKIRWWGELYKMWRVIYGLINM